MIDKHTTLFYKKVETIEDAELLRKIRNQCRQFMTQNTSHITKIQQKKWFKTAAIKYNLYIVYAIEYGAVVVEAGYGVIHKNLSDTLVTGGLLPDYRNKGLGKELFKFLTETSARRDLPVRLEVLKTNIRALKVYERLGYKIYQELENVYKMEYINDTVV